MNQDDRNLPRYETSAFPLVVSRIFEPWLLLVLVTVAGALHEGMTGNDLVRLLGIVIGIGVIPPVVALLGALRLRLVSNWDLSVRRERVRMMVLLCAFLVADNAVVRLLGMPYASRMFTVYTVWFLGFFGITLGWKLSGHTGVATLAAGLLYRWFGPAALPAFLVIPLIAWARIVGRRHTPAQAIGGVAYSLLLLFFMTKSGIL